MDLKCSDATAARSSAHILEKLSPKCLFVKQFHLVTKMLSYNLAVSPWIAMENSGRPYRSRQGSWERGAAAAENWRSQDYGRGGQTFRMDREQPSRNQSGPYRASPGKAPGPMSHSPGRFRGGHSPSPRDDLRWFSSPENTSDDHWRESRQQQQQHFRRNIPFETPKEIWEKGNQEDGSLNKSGEDLGIKNSEHRIFWVGYH